MAVKEVELEKLTGLRELTLKVSQHFENEIIGYLEALQPIFSTHRELGELIGGENVQDVPYSKCMLNFMEIDEIYRKVMLEGFDVEAMLANVVPQITNNLSVVNWQYSASIDDLDVAIVSPTEWVLSYQTDIDFQRLFEAKNEEKNFTKQQIANFVIASIIFQRLFEKSWRLVNLFEGLGLDVEYRTAPDLSADLKYVVIKAPVQSFRPTDEFLQMVVQFSGVNQFTELVDSESINALEDKRKLALQAYL